MSFKSRLIRIAIKWTPKTLVLWVANLMFKGIAALTDFSVDLDARTAYLQIQLVGESETIEVWLEGFAILREEDAYQLIIQQARSNRLWLANLLSRIVGKAWPIPVPAHMTAQMELVSELFKAENPEQEAI
jgi:hypothetical protein